MFTIRKRLYEELGVLRGSHVLAYVTGDRQGMETQIGSDALSIFVEHLDSLPGYNGKVSLLVHSRGGDIAAAWRIANLLRQFCEELEVIVPVSAQSAATLLCLGADLIVMTKQAVLGPIDPSVNTPLNPGIPGAGESRRYPVSVEAIRAFTDMANKELSLGDQPEGQRVVFEKLVDHIHPLVLGEVFRRQKQIRDLADRLLGRNNNDAQSRAKIIDFLCSESGSHDYTINRNEAEKNLNLKVEKPSEELYRILKLVYNDIVQELELNDPFEPRKVLGARTEAPFEGRRALIESVQGGSHTFVTRGTIRCTEVRTQDGRVQRAVELVREFEGWEHADE